MFEEPAKFETKERGGALNSELSGARLLQIFTFYENYTADFYAANPDLAHAPYAEQMHRLHRDGFCAFHVYAPELSKRGIVSDWVVANCEQTQKRWAVEHGFAFRNEHWKDDILRAQIAVFDPTILYTLNPIDFDSRFIRSLIKRPEMVIGWRAAEIPANVDWSEFDLILSHLSVCRERALQHGARQTKFFHPSLPEFLRHVADEAGAQFDVVFSGQWTPQHHVRNHIITALAEAAARGEFSLQLYLCSHNFVLPEVVQRFNAGARWGNDMYKALKSGRIVVNAEIDLARGEAGNLRLFESTAVGSFLLTEHQPNIDRYLSVDEHIDTYSSVSEMLQKIRFYIAQPEIRERKARAAQEHMFSQFSMAAGTTELTQILTETLPTALEREDGDTMPQQSDVNAAINAAIECLQVAQVGRALEIIENVSRIETKVRDVHHIKAVCLGKLARFDEAVVELKHEIKTFPDNQPARDLLSYLEIEVIGSQKSAQPVASIKITPTPSAPPASLTPSAMPTQTRLAHILATQAAAKPVTVTTAAPAAAVVEAPKVSAPQAFTIEELNAKATQAVSLLQKGDGVGALGIADIIANAAPQCQGVHYLRVLCLNAIGRQEEALEASKQELAINPAHQGARALFEQLSEALKRKVLPPLNPEQRSYHSDLDANTMKSIQNATHNYTYRGVPMIKNPFDFALYPLLLWNLKPKTIIEIGTKNGGSALWFGDMMNNYGIDGHIYSIDIVKVAEVSHEKVTFLEGDGRNLGATVSQEWLASLPRPLLVIEDADHSYETSSAVLKFFDPHVGQNEYIVIEDGIISDLEKDANCNSGPHRALKEFIAAHPGEYEEDSTYSDFFGYNYTWCTNGFLKKKKYAVNPTISKQLVTEFLKDDPAPSGIESQMSANERFQLYMAVRELLPRTQKKLRVLEIGSHAGASLKLQHTAAKWDGRELHAIAVEPGGLPSFYGVVQEIGASHVKAFSHAGLPAVKAILQDGVLPELMMIDGDHSYEGVLQDILDYYELLAPGGVMVFHDFLPKLDEHNREAIFFHHGGKEPGIRHACIEAMEEKFHATPIDLPLLYPEDPTQTQPHLPQIPGVFSTIRVYRKPRA